QASAKKNEAPANAVIVALLGITFVIAWMMTRPLMELAFYAPLIGSQPWSILTYPFAASPDGNNFIWLVVECLWLWGMGGFVEAELGTARYVGFWIASTLIN